MSALGIGNGTAPGGMVRVAMVPPLWHLFVGVAVGAALGFMAFRGRLAAAAWPLFALGLLAVPFLPWLTDHWPALYVVAGPARWALWGIVGWLLAAGGAASISRRLPALTPLLVFVVSASIYGGAAWRLTTGPIFPGGDEPHYLVMMQSLLRDGDLRIENNHARGDYREYFPRDLEPHYLTRGVDGEIYSVHPVGLPVLALPAYALGGYPGVVALLVLMAALAATLLWTWSRHVTGSADAATFGWAAAALTSPFLFNSFTVFPEVPAALAVMIALAWRPDVATTSTLIVRGLAVASLPWLSTKYAPMAGLAGVVVLLRSVRGVRAALAFCVPCAVSLAGWFLFFYVYWGTFSPSAPYGSQQNMALGNLLRGFPGLLFDQEYGVMALAPVLVVALAGLAMMWRERAAAIRSLEIIGVFSALLATVGAFHIWWGGSSSPGRPVTAGVLLFGLPVAWSFARVRASQNQAVRAVCHTLLAASLAIAAILLVVRQGALLNNSRDGSAILIEWMSPTWPVWQAFPSFIVEPPATALARTMFWVGLIALLALGARSVRRLDFGLASLLTLVAGGAAGVVAVSAQAGSPPTLEQRARIPFLDEYDASRRPIGIVYEPFSVVAPPETLSHFAFTGRSEAEGSTVQAPLLWNARFALPPGAYRLQIERSAEGPDDLGLQIGRTGDLYRRWPVTGPAIDETFVLPADVTFAGFRASNAFGHGSVRVTPLAVVDKSDRRMVPDVERVVRYGPFDLLAHDIRIGGEQEGFWTPGSRSTYITLGGSTTAPESVDIEIRCPSDNAVVFSATGWGETVDMQADVPRQLSIPLQFDSTLDQRVTTVRIDTRDTYIPAGGTSRDTRPLGCWIQMPMPRGGPPAS